jgi:hypothetical protein
VTDAAIARVLALVAEGRLTAEEAAPILDALDPEGPTAPRGAAPADQPGGHGRAAGPGTAGPRFARVEVREGGRTSVDLRVPLSLGHRALGMIPGLSSAQAAEINEAVSRGLTGPVVDIQDDDGGGVRIILE